MRSTRPARSTRRPAKPASRTRTGSPGWSGTTRAARWWRRRGLHAGGDHGHRDQQAERVGHDEPLAPVSRLGRVLPARIAADGVGCPYGLGVDDACRWFGVAALGPADLLPQHIEHPQPTIHPARFPETATNDHAATPTEINFSNTLLGSKIRLRPSPRPRPGRPGPASPGVRASTSWPCRTVPSPRGRGSAGRWWRRPARRRPSPGRPA